MRRLCLCLGIDVCDASNLTPDLVVSKAGEVVAELQRLRTKLSSTCDTLHTCEAELLNTRTTACAEKQRLQQQLESLQSHSQDIENRCRQSEKDLQLTRDRLAECEGNGDKLREEMRGFESRCCRLQNTIDRFQNDRIQYLRNIASMVAVPEPCETLIKDKVRDLLGDNQTLQTVSSLRMAPRNGAESQSFLKQLNNLRDQMSSDANRHREILETTNCRLRSEEVQKCSVEERFEKTAHELHALKGDHLTVSNAVDALR